MSTEGASGEPQAGTVAPAPDAGPGATPATPAEPSETIDGNNATGTAPDAGTATGTTTPPPAD